MAFAPTPETIGGLEVTWRCIDLHFMRRRYIIARAQIARIHGDYFLGVIPGAFLSIFGISPDPWGRASVWAQGVTVAAVFVLPFVFMAYAGRDFHRYGWVALQVQILRRLEVEVGPASGMWHVDPIGTHRSALIVTASALRKKAEALDKLIASSIPYPCRSFSEVSPVNLIKPLARRL